MYRAYIYPALWYYQLAYISHYERKMVGVQRHKTKHRDCAIDNRNQWKVTRAQWKEKKRKEEEKKGERRGEKRERNF